MTSTATILSLSRAALHKWLRFLALCMVACAGLAASLPAQAQQQCTITGPVTISFGTVTVPRDAPVGTLIGSPQQSTVTADCPASPGGASGFYLQYLPKLTVSSVAGVWDTGMAGIGIRVIDVTYNNTVMSALGQGSWDDFAAPVPTNTTYHGSSSFTYQLVKTAAQVTGGPLVIPQLFTLVSHNVLYDVSSWEQAPVSVDNTLIVALTCTVTTPSINVTLPPVRVSMLSPAGTTGGDTSFNIGLSCQPGANVHVTLTDATTPGNTTNNLTLAAGSTASGVKLRVLKSGAVPVNYGPDSALPGNPNQWLVGTSASTTQIPLTVQYISTGPVTPGTVKGLATFTMSYQ